MQFSFAPVVAAPVWRSRVLHATSAPPTSSRSIAKLRTPYVQIYNANIQHELGSRAAVQIGYVGSRGTRRCSAIATSTSSIRRPGAAPFPDFVYINQFESTARSRYNALQASLRARDWHGLTSTMNYTLSKSMDTASDGQDYVPNATQPDDSRNPEARVGAVELRRAASIHVVLHLGHHAGVGRSRAHVRLGGERRRHARERPADQRELPVRGRLQRQRRVLRPAGSRGRSVRGHRAGRDQFLNLSAFAAPCTPNGDGGCAGGQHFGNLRRNAFYGPSLPQRRSCRS